MKGQQASRPVSYIALTPLPPHGHADPAHGDSGASLGLNDDEYDEDDDDNEDDGDEDDEDSPAIHHISDFRDDNIERAMRTNTSIRITVLLISVFLAVALVTFSILHFTTVFGHSRLRHGGRTSFINNSTSVGDFNGASQGSDGATGAANSAGTGVTDPSVGSDVSSPTFMPSNQIAPSNPPHSTESSIEPTQLPVVAPVVPRHVTSGFGLYRDGYRALTLSNQAESGHGGESSSINPLFRYRIFQTFLTVIEPHAVMRLHVDLTNRPEGEVSVP
jgi:hypothetical protein